MKAILIHLPQLSSYFHAAVSFSYLPALYEYLKYFGEVVVFCLFWFFLYKESKPGTLTQPS